VRVRALVLVLELVLTIAALVAAPGARGADGEVDPAEDDPPGCTTATAEDEDQ
jgi:hypothetical protein